LKAKQQQKMSMGS